MKLRGLFTAIFVAITKSAIVLKMLKVLKALKFAKFLITFLTMFLSAFLYAFWLGPWFSIGFVLLIFIHEMGHVVALRIKGIPASAPIFIPFLGAAVFTPSFGDRETEAFCGFAGPLIGSIAAAAVFGIWAIIPSHPVILLLLSYTALFINLFNLIPLRPLDGGRSTQVIGEWFKYVGIAALFIFSIAIRQPSILLIWILVLADIPMNSRFRFLLSILCNIAMTTLMLLGYSGQPAWVNGIDIFLATLFNMVACATMKLEDQKEYSESELRRLTGVESTTKPVEKEEPIPIKIRIMWFFLYVSLALAIFLMMHMQIPYMPHQVK